MTVEESSQRVLEQVSRINHRRGLPFYWEAWWTLGRHHSTLTMGCFQVDMLSFETTHGKFISYDGRELPW